ncbi:MAG: OadG family transporter subunit [Eubacteriales bacterium]|nr:OadG family transporter subunit [Eubacteriales bacterium]
MKLRMNKITSLCAVVFAAATLTAGVPAMVYGTENTEETVEAVETVEETAEETTEAETSAKEEETIEEMAEEDAEAAEETEAAAEETPSQEEQMQAYAKQLVQSLTESLIVMSDEDIENYKQSTDAFTVEAVTAWQNAKKDLGDRVTSENAEDAIQITQEEGSFVGTYPVDFEKADAEFVYTFDQNLTPVSARVDVNIPLSTTLKNAGLNTLMGVGIVFCVLLFLSFLISLFKYIPDPEKKKMEEAKKAAAEKKAAAAAAPVVEEEEYANDEELVAVIMAAIAASEGTSTDGFVVRSIRKARRAR